MLMQVGRAGGTVIVITSSALFIISDTAIYYYTISYKLNEKPQAPNININNINLRQSL